MIRLQIVTNNFFRSRLLAKSGGDEPDTREVGQTLARRRAAARRQSPDHELVMGRPGGEFAPSGDGKFVLLRDQGPLRLQRSRAQG